MPSMCKRIQKNSDLAARLDNSVEITCTHKHMLIERSNEDFEGDVDIVIEAGQAYAAGGMTKAAFDEIQLAVSQNFNPLGFVADRRLRAIFRPLDVLNQDWVHGVLCKGIMDIEMSCWLEADAGASMKDYETFMKSDLQFPVHYQTKGSYLWRVFDEFRNEEEEAPKIKASASELLGMYALMRHFIELRFKERPHDHAAERASFLACCNVVDVILNMKTGLLDPKSDAGCDELENAVFDHLKRHIEIYGTDHIKPKHHLNHALAKQFKKRGVHDAFIAERLHLRVKWVAELMKNMAHFERHTIGRVMQRQITELNAGGSLRSGLRGKVKKSSCDGLYLASRLECASLKIAVGDVVVSTAKLSAGIVRACAADEDGQLFVIVKVLQWLDEVTDHSGLWSPTPRLETWHANALASPRAWYSHGADLVVIW